MILFEIAEMKHIHDVDKVKVIMKSLNRLYWWDAWSNEMFGSLIKVCLSKTKTGCSSCVMSKVPYEADGEHVEVIWD